MTRRRLCIGCMEDWAEPDSVTGQCLCCGLERERATRLGIMRFGATNQEDAEWWGPTIDDVNPEDLDGFYIAHTTDAADADLPYLHMLERWGSLRSDS